MLCAARESAFPEGPAGVWEGLAVAGVGAPGKNVHRGPYGGATRRETLDGCRSTQCVVTGAMTAMAVVTIK